MHFIIQQCGQWMTEVIKVLGWEPENSIERQRAVGAARDLEMLKGMVLSIQGQGEQEQPSNDADSTQSKPEFDIAPEQDSFIEEVF